MCADASLKVESIPQAKEACKKDAACMADLRARVYASVKFRFYNLVERSGVLLKAGASEDTVAQFAVFAEEKKQDFNAATTLPARVKIVEQVQQEWKAFKRKAVAEIRAK